jgi:hypothetical protein
LLSQEATNPSGLAGGLRTKFPLGLSACISGETGLLIMDDPESEKFSSNGLASETRREEFLHPDLRKRPQVGPRTGSTIDVGRSGFEPGGSFVERSRQHASSRNRAGQ